VPAAFDCGRGCSLVGTGVCGANGVTFINACLAHCAGTPVAYAGPCTRTGTFGATATGTAGAAGAGGNLSRHPTGRFMVQHGPLELPPAAAGTARQVGAVAAAAAAAALAAAGPPPRAADAADIRRYASEGFVLVGAARVGAFTVAKPRAAPGGRCAGGAPASGPTA
jgi:hypothetical protein